MALLAAATLLSTAAFVAASPKDPWRGKWEATDAVDGSNLTMSFGGGGDTREVTLFDDHGSLACPPDGGPVRASGTGVISDDGREITGDLSWKCANGETGSGTFTYIYDPETDTLSESNDTVWHRPGGC